jgi:hypothetical protein
MSMLTGMTIEDMYIYYTIATVHAVATSKSLRLFVEIPLKAADRYFELFQVHSLPFFHVGISRYVMVDEPFSYIADSGNRQFFAVITPHQLASCTRDVYTVCPPDLVLRTPAEPSCLIALFLGKADVMTHLCERLILEDMFEPVWIQTPDLNRGYTVSVGQHRSQCNAGKTDLPSLEASHQITLHGTGLLLDSSSCYIHSEVFKFLPHSFGKSEITLNRSRIELPNIYNIFNSSE